MTALKQFQRLEAQGSWRPNPDAPAREVVVSLGDATLILSDPATERPLSHWSLPAVVRVDGGAMPAVYAPGPDGTDESVVIDDPLMIQAIARIKGAVAGRRAPAGRLRGSLAILGVLAALGALMLWLPDALVAHAARIAPPAQARAMGTAILADLETGAGAVCTRASGQAVLNHLAPLLLSQEAIIRVLPEPLGGARRLPGEVYVIGNDLLRAAPGPEAAAAHLVAARLAAGDADLRAAAMTHAGLLPALGLMTIGHLPQTAMAGFGTALLSQPAPRPQDAALLAALAERGIPAEPYARSIDPTGQSVRALTEGDPLRGGAPSRPLSARPLLTDEQWLALQQICAG